MTHIPPSLANLRGAVDLSSLVRPPGPRPAAGGAAAASGAAPGAAGSAASADPLRLPSLVLEATDASFTALLDLSAHVPVVVEIHVGGASTVLADQVRGFAGRLILATVDATANPQLQQAFQATVAPTVSAVIAGRPLALYEGELPAGEARQVLEQLLVVAAQNGVTGTVSVAEGADPAESAQGAEAATAAQADTAAPVEEALPPHHQEAYDAIDRGDFEAALGFYRTAIAQDPRDRLAVAGLAQVSLLHRLTGSTPDSVGAAAASAPGDVTAELAAADLDMSGGRVDDAFARLLDLFAGLDADSKNQVRTRLLDYFEIAGADDPRVTAARRRLTMLLY